MGEKTKIQWAHDSVNIITGCSKVSPGCKNCYAERTSLRGAIGGWGDKAPRKFHERAVALAYKLNKKPWICSTCGAATDLNTGPCLQNISEPGSSPWRCNGELQRRRIFNMSHGDWLDERIPPMYLARMLHTLLECDQVYWLLLTKRPENFAKLLMSVVDVWGQMSVDDMSGASLRKIERWLDSKPPEHFWIGTSVENQEYAEARMPAVLKIPAKLHFLSVEPLLGPIGLKGIWDAWNVDGNYPGIDWVIVGGESGSRKQARPCAVRWIRDVVADCHADHVPVFVKQLGTNVIARNDDGFEGDTPTAFPMDTNFREMAPQVYQGEPVKVLLKHHKGGEPAEWPEDLRVREFPKTN